MLGEWLDPLSGYSQTLTLVHRGAHEAHFLVQRKANAEVIAP